MHLGFHQKYLNMCSEDERRSYGFGMTWGWVVNDIIYIFGWTIPLMLYCVTFIKIKLIKMYRLHFKIVWAYAERSCTYRTFAVVLLLIHFICKQIHKHCVSITTGSRSVGLPLTASSKSCDGSQIQSQAKSNAPFHYQHEVQSAFWSCSDQEPPTETWKQPITVCCAI